MATVDEGTSSQHWWTPPEVIEPARRVLGAIDLDPASCDEANRMIVGATRYYTPDQDGLAQPWEGRTWMNCPYGRGCMPSWTGRLVSAVVARTVPSAIALVNNDPSTKWFQSLAAYATVIGYPVRRLRFIHGDPSDPMYRQQAKTGQQRAQAIIGLRVDPVAFVRHFAGICWFVWPAMSASASSTKSGVGRKRSVAHGR